MAEVFLRIINMSISASWIVLAVLLLRPFLKKAPKWAAVALWGIIAVRLICPFSFESVLSLIPSAETVSPGIMMDPTPQIHTGISILNSSLNPMIGESFSPAPGDSANPLQILVPIWAAVWAVGAAALLIYAAVSYIRIRNRVQTAVLIKDNLYQSEKVDSPFVLGIIKPKIYLPYHISEQDMAHVVAHEQAHIRRRDHLWKPLGFLLLALHWFNPLMWLSYVLLCRDIELACDEKVIRELDHDARADYSQALLTCSVDRRTIAACPLAFGEVGVKDRVKSVLSYKKPAFWLTVGAVAICMVFAVCFLTNPKGDRHGETDPNKLNETQLALMEQYPDYFGLDASEGLDVYVWQMAPESYSFALLPHSEAAHSKFSTVLLRLKSVRAEEMRIILSTYDISRDEIHIVPWQNPISSYIGVPWITSGVNPEEVYSGYIAKVRTILFGEDVNGVTLVYSHPAMSYVMDPSQLPQIRIVNDSWCMSASGQLLGTVMRTKPDKTCLSQLTQVYGGYYKKTIQELLQENNSVYEVFPNSPDSIDLYYILGQKDGSTLLVYGHYENGEKNDLIRWIFRREK